jgi:glycerophosphoryl diester phosphodiesterase
MILISHRGNLTGPNPTKENSLPYIQEALDNGFDVEIDIWFNDGVFYLGHDVIQYEVTLDWLKKRKNNLWIHCKNIEAIEWFNNSTVTYNYFWHQEDTVTLTSKNFIWAYPGKQPINRSIAVMPEIFNDKINLCIGVCSDYIQNYKK